MALSPVRKQDSGFETDTVLICSCQTPHFVLAFAYAQTSHTQLFSAPDGVGAGASTFKMMEVSRHKQIQTLAGYVRQADQFKQHAGAAFM